MRLSRLLLCLPLLGLLGCGNIVYQTRYIPTTAELTWEKDYKQLPWKPPALGPVHYPRSGSPAKPRFAPEIHYDIEKPKGEYRYENDGKGIPAQ